MSSSSSSDLDLDSFFSDYFVQLSPSTFDTRIMATGGSKKIKTKVLDTRRLSESEDLTSFKQWQASLLYTLRKDDRFVEFIEATPTRQSWNILSDDRNDLRDFTNDAAAANGTVFTAQMKLAHLNDFLLYCASLIPIFCLLKSCKCPRISTLSGP